MAIEYFDYGNINKTAPASQNGAKDTIAKVSRNTLNEKADQAAAERKEDLKKVKDRAEKAQDLNTVKTAIESGAQNPLTGKSSGLESLLSGLGGNFSRKI